MMASQEKGEPTGTSEAPVLSIPKLIETKRDGKELTQAEVDLFVRSVTDESMAESQIGAMLMAIYLKGMTANETTSLTNAMMNSGDVLEWPKEWKGSIVDKHSTGGVGDKISLSLAPALAACGVKVPMISGRGLGHTGGTLDKLESIEGYDIYQSPENMRDILEKVGCCIVGQTASLVPADKRLYAVRDVTATVSNIPLITGSIISKKGAEGLDALVLDVKTGRAAVMQSEAEARELAETMVRAGNGIGMNTTSVLTRMDCPIGRMVGNALEIVETIQCLHGQGPRTTRELVHAEGGHCLYNAGKADSPEEGAKMISKALDDGSALTKFCMMLKAVGVRPDLADRLCAQDADLYSILPAAQHKTDILSCDTGYAEDIDAMVCANVSGELGAGRTVPNGPIDHAVGLELHVELGDHINKGDRWVTVHHNTDLPQEKIDRLQAALTISPTEVQRGSLIIDVIKCD